MVDKIRIIEKALGVNFVTPDICLNTKKCITSKHRRITCDCCARVCPKDCIEISTYSISFDDTDCCHCGACVAACPFEAFSSKWLSKKELLNKIVGAIDACEGNPVLACTNALELLDESEQFLFAGKIITLPCLNRIDVTMLMTMFASKAKKVVLVRGQCDKCENCIDNCENSNVDCENSGGNCENSGGMKVFEQNVESVKDAIKSMTLQNDLQIEIRRDFPEWVHQEEESENKKQNSYGMSRRDLVSGLKSRAIKAAGSVADEVALGSGLQDMAKSLGILEKDSPLITEPKERVCQWAMAALVEPILEKDPFDERRAIQIAQAYVDMGIFGLPEIDHQGCTNCQMCTYHCKTGALAKEKEGKRVVGFAMRPYLCNQCRACEDVCKYDCLKLQTEVRLTDVLLEKKHLDAYD